MTRLLGLARRPQSWAHLILAGAALVAIGDGAILVLQASGVGPRSAAGWFVGAVGLVLAILVALSLVEDAHGVDESVIAEIAAEIISEEEEAGREVEDHFSTETESLPPREMVRALVLSALLMAGWMILLHWIGFAAVTGLFCLVFIRFIGRRRLWVALVAAIAVAIGLAVVFDLAGVLLPVGALWYLF